MYLGDRDLFVFMVAAAALSAAAAPDEYFRRAEDVKASPELPPGSPYSPPAAAYAGGAGAGGDEGSGGEGGGAVFGGQDVRSDGNSDSTVSDLSYSSRNSSSRINYSYQDILRLGG